MEYPTLGYSATPRSEAWANGPTAANAHVLGKTIEHMNSVPYRVSLRWLFYRLLQDGTLAGKDSYNSFKGLIAKARHSGIIQPSAIADEGRRTINLGGNFESVIDWRENFAKRLRDGFQCVDTMGLHDPYVIVAFEAKAMAAQFEAYASPYDVMLYPFGGDPSIGFKWQLTKHIKDRLDRGQKAVLLYFGDKDPKGRQIAETAMRHVRKFLCWQHGWVMDPWGDNVSELAFTAYHVGLLQRHVDEFGIAEQPDKPGHYQWEALTDQQAAQLITGALNEFVDLDAMARHQQDERDQLEGIAETLEEWESEA